MHHHIFTFIMGKKRTDLSAIINKIILLLNPDNLVNPVKIY